MAVQENEESDATEGEHTPPAPPAAEVQTGSTAADGESAVPADGESAVPADGESTAPADAGPAAEEADTEPDRADPAAPAPAASAPTPPEPQPRHAPVVELTGLGLRGTRGWAFRDVDLVALPGDLVVITGGSGSGRSALLLAIAGRLRPSAGTLEVTETRLDASHRARHAVRQVRQRVAVARIAEHIGLDGDLPVQTNARDAADWAKHRRADVQDRLQDWRSRTGLVLEPRTPVGELTALEATALHLLLAAVVDPDIIVLDDADAALTPTEQDQLWQIAAEVAASGPTVIATATDVPAQADVHVVLHRHSGPSAHAASSASVAETPPEEAVAEEESPPDRDTSPGEPGTPGTPGTPGEPDHPGTPDDPDPVERPTADPDHPGADRDGAHR